MPFCHSKNSDFGSPQEQTDYIRYNEAHGFPTAVQTWIKNIWSFGQNMKLVSLEVNGANISKQEMHAFIWAGGRLSSSTDRNNNLYISNKGNSARIVVECVGKSSVRKLISLPYDDSNVIHLNAVHTPKYHPSIWSTKVSNAPILKTIEKSEELIVSEDDLLSFFRYTKFSTFGAFELGEKSYIVMLVPEKYASNMSYSCHLFSTP